MSEEKPKEKVDWAKIKSPLEQAKEKAPEALKLDEARRLSECESQPHFLWLSQKMLRELSTRSLQLRTRIFLQSLILLSYGRGRMVVNAHEGFLRLASNGGDYDNDYKKMLKVLEKAKCIKLWERKGDYLLIEVRLPQDWYLDAPGKEYNPDYHIPVAVSLTEDRDAN